MCGICGFVISEKKTSTINYRKTLKNMTDCISHRGPDQCGQYYTVTDNINVGFGHQRLSIIDLSKQGNQPIFNETHKVCIIFNGEIYNFQELKHRLTAKGHSFSSKSDTETILHLFEEEGHQCTKKLNGMFAFAIWDNLQKKLFVARDPLGIKPLFYTEVSGGLAFSSEIKSLFKLPYVSKEPDPVKIDEYLTFGYVPGPGTIYKGIYSLQPGHWMQWYDGSIHTHCYWSPDNNYESTKVSVGSLVEELDSILNDTIKNHLIADVPVGAFLSGGVDSSLVSAIASKYTEEPLHTFTIGFSGGGDEREYAREVATHIGSVHHERLVDPDLTNKLPQLVWHLDQPLFDNSILPTFLVSNLAKEQGKVVLAGDGGDEPFIGYGWTRAATTIPGLPLPFLPSYWQWNYQKGLIGYFRRGIFDITHGATEKYLRRITTFKQFRHNLYTKSFLNQIHDDPQDIFRFRINNFHVKYWKDRFALADLMFYLPEDVLFKVDRMSMAHGLEVRVPLLDHNLIEWILKLPWHLRCRQGIGKYLLKKVAAKYLPPLILKPRKQGFTVPIERWLKSDIGNMAKRIFRSKTFSNRNIICPDKALSLINLHQSNRFELGHRIWSLLFLEIWFRVWVDDQSPNQTIASMLNETGD
ncbi:MAG: asparagine synthase (glutamine-hydrolyzing) [Chitinispirillia bacterium]|jgi:asparagine synthase (glutamine-hydrolysing)